jgi:hypothetical protein
VGSKNVCLEKEFLDSRIQRSRVGIFCDSGCRTFHPLPDMEIISPSFAFSGKVRMTRFSFVLIYSLISILLFFANALHAQQVLSGVTISAAANEVWLSQGLNSNSIWTGTPQLTRMGLGTAADGTASLLCQQNALATTYTNGLILQNITASTSGTAVQQSPSLQLLGHVWSTTSTAADSTRAFDLTVVPVSSANPLVTNLIFRTGNGGTNMNEVFGITSKGGMRINGSLLSNGPLYTSSTGIINSYSSAGDGGVLYWNGNNAALENQASYFYYDYNNQKLAVGYNLFSTGSSVATIQSLYPSSTTNAPQVCYDAYAYCTGTTAAGFGAELRFRASTSTSNDYLGEIQGIWTTATNATRTGALVYTSKYQAGALTEMCRMAMTAGGAAPKSTFTLGVANTTAGILELAGGNSANTIKIQTTNSAITAYTLTLPNSGGTANYVLNTNGSGTTNWQTPIAFPRTEYSTSMENSARFTTGNDGTSGSNTFGTKGDVLATNGSAAGYAKVTYTGQGNIKNGTNVNVYWCANISYQSVSSTDQDQFIGLDNGTITVATSGITFTGNHIGFKITQVASGTISLYATNADGTTETASSALATIANGDNLFLAFVYNTAGSIDYYWRQNTGAWSSSTNQTTHIPTNLSNMTAAVSSRSTTPLIQMNVSSMSVKAY